MEDTFKWLPVDQATVYFGYSNPESLRQRLRELRRRGKVLDLGAPPLPYKAAKKATEGKIIIYWPNPNTALIRSDAPRELLVPKRGKRARDLDT